MHLRVKMIRFRGILGASAIAAFVASFIVFESFEIDGRSYYSEQLIQNRNRETMEMFSIIFIFSFAFFYCIAWIGDYIFEGDNKESYSRRSRRYSPKSSEPLLHRIATKAVGSTIGGVAGALILAYLGINAGASLINFGVSFAFTLLIVSMIA